MVFIVTKQQGGEKSVHPPFGKPWEAASASGEGLVELAKEEAEKLSKTRLQTKVGYLVEPWVVMVQVIEPELLSAAICSITPPGPRLTK